MATTKKMLTIDVNMDINDIVTAKQGDANSRFLDIKLIDKGLAVNLNNHRVRFSAVKPDGRRIYNNCEITDAAKGRFQAELTNQTLAVPGRVWAEFTLYGLHETEVLTTKTFNIIVLENLFDEEAVISTNEFGAAAILFQEVSEMREIILAMDKLLKLNLDAKISSRASQTSLDDLYEKIAQLGGSTKKILTPGDDVVRKFDDIVFNIAAIANIPTGAIPTAQTYNEAFLQYTGPELLFHTNGFVKITANCKMNLNVIFQPPSSIRFDGVVGAHCFSPNNLAYTPLSKDKIDTSNIMYTDTTWSPQYYNVPVLQKIIRETVADEDVSITFEENINTTTYCGVLEGSHMKICGYYGVRNGSQEGGFAHVTGGFVTFSDIKVSYNEVII